MHAHFSLDNFKGPLDLLLYLIQKEEVDVCEVSVNQLTTQWLGEMKQPQIEDDSETLGLLSLLLLLKSQRLLPSEEGEQEPQEVDPRLQLFEMLTQYSQFREAATSLAKREATQKSRFARAAPLPEQKKNFGLNQVSLDELKETLLAVMSRVDKKPPSIEVESWQVAPLLATIRNLLTQHSSLPFHTLFTPEKCQEELIVTFLALLELMKMQEVVVVREKDHLYIVKGHGN